MTLPFPLGRIAHYDNRSRGFHVYRLVNPDQQNTLVTKQWDCHLVLDQGREGSCVGHGHAHCLVTDPTVDENVTEATALSIYHLSQKIANIPPGHEGSTVLAGAKAVQQLWPTAYGAYFWAFGIQNLLVALSHVGPVVLGIPWYSGMYRPKSNGVIEPTGELSGGHCILATGLDVSAHTVTLRNSWGPNWGQSGSCRISWVDLNKLLRENGECLVPTNRVKVSV